MPQAILNGCGTCFEVDRPARSAEEERLRRAEHGVATEPADLDEIERFPGALPPSQA